jgi:hypothetical protein
MADEIEIPGAPWDQGKCPFWHMPCKEARADCNMWKEHHVEVKSPLNVMKKGTAHICEIFAMADKIKNSIIMTPQVPGAAPGPKFHRIGG